MRPNLTILILILIAALAPSVVHASGGPFGIDHKLHYDNTELWQRSTQLKLQYATIATVVGGAFVLGDDSKLGDTFWRSLDAMAVSGLGAQGMKLVFQRKRPSQTDNPNDFFKGAKYQSFPSGEVAALSGAVTPFIVRYGGEHPAVYALALLPAYDAVARMKVHGHWQSDVLVGAALGVGVGLWAAHRKSSLTVGLLPGGLSVGYVHRF